jgi:DNA-binding NtrC family response regulator
MISHKVLIIDDNEDILLAAKLLLKPYAGVVHTEKDPNAIPQLLADETYDVIFLDMNFTEDTTSGQEGLYWLKEILRIDPGAVVILITAYGDVEMAVNAIKEGATDFVLKPWQNEKLIATFSSAVKLHASRDEIENLRSRQEQLTAYIDQNFHDLIGSSVPMRAVFSSIEKVAATDANILILGENGTGKELIARALHKQSNRADEVFISVDMGAISGSLFESELFGHMKGAFTDAKEDRAGRFESANDGTLFLDEIGNIPIELQAKLLSVLQSRMVTRVGSNKQRPIDIRLICATNMPIQQMVAENKFRQDLLYRINTIEIAIPPLRERGSDITLLSEYFLNVFAKKYNKPALSFHPATIAKLMRHSWPGNVRELQHAIERAVIMCDSPSLQPTDFFFRENHNKEDFSIENYNLEEIEKSVIRKILSKQNGNISKAAKELGITRTALYRRMEKFGL